MNFGKLLAWATRSRRKARAEGPFLARLIHPVHFLRKP
jgi:hypothetical protein